LEKCKFSTSNIRAKPIEGGDKPPFLCVRLLDIACFLHDKLLSCQK
mgnify:CR=1